MSRFLELPPNPASLSASLRDIGYSLEAAIADLIDNSISAGATRVDITCDLGSENPTLVIADNGAGMNGDTLVEAMRHGSRGPRAERSATDLGRFGLGLKTASFSQCRKLTVISAQGGERSGASWDLDEVEASNSWRILVLDRADLDNLPYRLEGDSPGTLVIWQKLDRLFEEESGLTREELVNEKLDLVRNHLALVFHRFIDGELAFPKLALFVNGYEIKSFDPFCRSNRATQRLPKDTVIVDGHKVEIQAYVLPHHSRLSERDYQFYKSRSDFISNQGAYIYRNGRLMAWGDWFRLVPKGEATKLGRVQIDFPNALDEAWTIDIKKSRATPPRPVREHLRQILPKITSAAIKVHRGRGQKLFEETESPLWERFADQERVRYTLNLEHNLVGRMMALLRKEEDKRHLLLLLDSIGSSLPVEMIYSDYSIRPREVKQLRLTEEEASQRLHELRLILFPEGTPNGEEFRSIVASTRLFWDCPETVEKFIREELS